MATRYHWLLFIALLCISSPSYSAGFSKAWDGDIEDAVRQYWPDLDAPLLWKAQLVAESNLNPNVCSSVGACGLAQFMLPTWRDITREIGYTGTEPRADGRIAIQAGAYYQHRMRTSWSGKDRTPFQRNDLGLCAYNRGLGNCLKDQAECGGAILWKDIALCTARHTDETINYIARINNLFRMMELQ